MLLATSGRFHRTSGNFHDERQHIIAIKPRRLWRHVLALEKGPIFHDVKDDLEIRAVGGP